MQKIKNIFYIFFPLALSICCAFLIRDHIDYQYLIRPKLAPSPHVFGVVWTILYLLLGISFYLYKKNTIDGKVDKVYYLVLFLNNIWPLLFFNLKFRFIATVEIIVLDMVSYAMLFLFFKYHKKSFYLNIPYGLWILFATYLSYSIYLLN